MCSMKAQSVVCGNIYSLESAPVKVSLRGIILLLIVFLLLIWKVSIIFIVFFKSGPPTLDIILVQPNGLESILTVFSNAVSK